MKQHPALGPEILEADQLVAETGAAPRGVGGRRTGHLLGPTIDEQA